MFSFLVMQSKVTISIFYLYFIPYCSNVIGINIGYYANKHIYNHHTINNETYIWDLSL